MLCIVLEKKKEIEANNNNNRTRDLRENPIVHM